MLSRIAAVVLSFCPTSALAQEWKEPDVEEATEHPLLKFYPQSSVREYTDTAFDSVELFTGYDRKQGERVSTTVEGRVIKIHA